MTNKEAFDLIAAHAVPGTQADGGPRQVPKRDIYDLLRGLERQGEDNIWRTAQQAREEIEMLRTQLAHWKVFGEHAEGERSRMQAGHDRYVFVKTLEGQVVVMNTLKSLGAAALDQAIDDAMDNEFPSAPPYAPEMRTHFCWLIELFLPQGNSMGYYHTGFTTLMPGESRTTRDPLQAKRYATQGDALHIADGLHNIQGVWRAVEHGFGA